MADFRITPSRLQSSAPLLTPPSKSQTLRAILFALLASGKSTICHPLESPDTVAMLTAAQHFGAKVTMAPDKITIEGVAGKLEQCRDVIDCGNSGQVLRFIGALAGLCPHYTILTGDASIRERRPVKPLLNALTQLGVTALSALNNDKAPIIIKGPIIPGSTTLIGIDSQPVSGLIIALSLAAGPSDIHVKEPGETPWIDLTLSWLDRFHIPYKKEGYTHYSLQGHAKIPPFEYTVPADLSSVAYPLCAAIITNSPLTLTGIDLSDPQGDKILISHLQQMGADITLEKNQLLVGTHHKLVGRAINVNACIDAVTILAVVGCFAEGETTISGAEIARHKESDRIHAICLELKKMGANIEELPGGLSVRRSQLKGTTLNTHFDHRLVLSLSVAALAAQGPSLIQDTAPIRKSYPSFFEDMRSLGANIEVVL